MAVGAAWLGRLHACYGTRCQYAEALPPALPCVLPWQAEANCGALGWRLTADEVEQLDALAIEGQLKFGQHG